MKILVWTRENGHSYQTEIRYKRPRNYMTGWSFDRLLKYIKDELEWEDIKPQDVECITIRNEKERWENNICKTNC